MSDLRTIDYMDEVAAIYGLPRNGNFESHFCREFNINSLMHILTSMPNSIDARACLFMLLTGARISEVESATLIKVDGVTKVRIYCKKQDKFRLLKVPANSILNELVPVSLPWCRSGISSKAVQRFIKRYLKDFIPGPDFMGHKACHIMRYIHIGALSAGFWQPHPVISAFLGWSSEDMVSVYLEYATYIKRKTDGFKRDSSYL